jgi:hypothetical protein
MNLSEYKKYTNPFLRYEFNNCFDGNMLQEINAMIENNEQEENNDQEENNEKKKITSNYEGKRINNKHRCFITNEYLKNNKQYIHLQELIKYLQKDEVIQFFETIGNISLKDCYLRIEIILDKENFWLEKHKDIIEKKISFLIYINDNNEDTNNGTDLYDEDLTLAHSIPFIHNLGYVFFPANNTWHGLEKGKNIKHRKCVLINYVTFKTDFKL